ncbi:MAG: PASTA domain-containing protein [Alphaproteobacteria bacterium]|nr:PASTA domain-containing protein [Alphaproteobacteria bacterium]
MAQYTFGTPYCFINNTRALINDTLIASAALRVMNAQGALHQDYPATAISLGNHHSHVTVALDALNFWNVDVPDPTPDLPDGGAAYWTFVLTNSGNTDSAFDDILKKAVDDFAQGVAGQIVSDGASFATILSLAGLLGLQELINVLTADCDGIVGAFGLAFTAKQLAQMTSDPVKINCPGTTSPVGCGANSNYNLYYFTAPPPPPPPPPVLVTVPDVVRQSPTQARATAAAAGLGLVEIGFDQILPPGSNPYVESQSPASGAQADKGSNVKVFVATALTRGHPPQ